MKTSALILLLFISTQVVAQHNLKDMTALQKLKGSWQSERKKGTLIERWTIVNDSTLYGYSYIKTATDSIPEEKVELLLRQGKISYIADAAGQNSGHPVAFALSKVEAGTWYFENRSHDFPQVITYHLAGDNTLNATIYGPMNGKEISVEFNFKRIE